MAKIVVMQPMSFSAEHKARLDNLGDVTYYDDVAPTPEEWLKRCQGADIICSGITGLRDKYSGLKDVFISVPFVGVGTFADPAVLKANNITLCNSPGCNRHAVSEWITFMMIETMRRLAHYINTAEPAAWPPATAGLAERNVTILGKGNIGMRVGEICKAFEMKVNFFTRADNLAEKVRDADVVIDTLSGNPSTNKLLGKDFFDAMKKGATFISITVDSIVDMDAMLAAIDSGKLAAVAYDVMNARPGNSEDPLYLRLKQHPKVYVTPHIAAHSDVTDRIGNDMMIDNIEAWLAGNPINVFGK